MRKRDLGILLIAAFAVFVSLQHESNFSFREVWFHTSHHEATHVDDHRAADLPPPIVADLNGDGRKEVIFATSDAHIQVVHPVVSSAGEGFHNARLLAEVSLQPAGVNVGSSSRQAVAMAVGFIDPPPHHSPPSGKGGEGKGRGGRAARRRKAVLAVVTAGWSILVFDHNMKLMWENSVQAHFPHMARHKEVAIFVSNQTMHKGDRGVIIVGGSMESRPEDFLDAFEEEEDEEEAEERHARGAGKKEDLEDVSGGTPGINERHFSYYTFEGGKGAIRWKHDSKDFHRDVSVLSQELLPQHNYKLDANALSARHFGEVECRDYRHSILGHMPHSWDRRSDTLFELSSFHRHKRRHHKKLPGSHHGHQASSARHTAGRDHSNVVAKVVGKAVDMAAKGRRAKLAEHPHNLHGNHSAHLPWLANSIVAHLQEGIEVVHLYSGRTICKLLLPQGGLHADINGDGVLDHVVASGANGAEQSTIEGETDEDGGVGFVPIKPCTAVATSGVPVRELLFNGSVCKERAFFQAHAFDSDEANWAADSHRIEVATPILLPRKDGKRHRKGSHGDVLFLNSEGVVTSFATEGLRGKGPHGHMRWQIETSATWTPDDELGGMEHEATVPTFKAISLKAGGEPEVALAIGELGGVVLAPNGAILTTLTMPTPPVAPIVVADFSGDKLNDLIVVTNIGTYGFIQYRQPGAYLFSSLAACLIVVICVIFVSLHMDESRGKSRGSSDRRGTDLE